PPLVSCSGDRALVSRAPGGRHLGAGARRVRAAAARARGRRRRADPQRHARGARRLLAGEGRMGRAPHRPREARRRGRGSRPERRRLALPARRRPAPARRDRTRLELARDPPRPALKGTYPLLAAGSPGRLPRGDLLRTTAIASAIGEDKETDMNVWKAILTAGGVLALAPPAAERA